MKPPLTFAAMAFSTSSFAASPQPAPLPTWAEARAAYLAIVEAGQPGPDEAENGWPAFVAVALEARRLRDESRERIRTDAADPGPMDAWFTLIGREGTTGFDAVLSQVPPAP